MSCTLLEHVTLSRVHVRLDATDGIFLRLSYKKANNTFLNSVRKNHVEAQVKFSLKVTEMARVTVERQLLVYQGGGRGKGLSRLNNGSKIFQVSKKWQRPSTKGRTVSPVGAFRDMKMTGMFVDPLTGRNRRFWSHL